MRREPVTVRPEMEVEQAVILLLKRRISRAPVVDEHGKLVGILAERDCLKAFLNDEFCRCPTALVKDLMSSDVVTVGPDVDILTAADLFLHHKFHHLPVLDEDRLVGQISRRDVIRAILKMHRKPVRI
jgi:CBS domain-containing protein